MVDATLVQNTEKSLQATSLDMEGLIFALNSLQEKLRTIQQHAISEFQLTSVSDADTPSQLTIQLRANLNVLAEVAEAKRDLFGGSQRLEFEKVILSLNAAAESINRLDAFYNGLLEDE